VRCANATAWSYLDGAETRTEKRTARRDESADVNVNAVLLVIVRAA